MSTPLELWAGIECTLNRVQNTYFDQLAMSGHLTRMTDLDRIAGLGIRTLRFPIRWEQVAPHGLDQADWAWVDERLARLRELGIRPITGLLHHGSGPPHTSLIDPAFPAEFSAYAQAVAERYPWLDAYTPINEPLTTARFSCLYGFWYPHARSAAAFSQAVILQIEATRQAMEAIRTVNPAAQLVQTEDIGKTYSTPQIEYQAEFDNLRRWLTFDLLTGQLDLDGPLARFMTHFGVDRTRLESFCEQPSPPDVIGLNYYITSERFLDDRLDLYPEGVRGGNGQHAYADVEAVRVCAGGTAGFEGMLQETWDRYHRPLAITEVQLGSTPEQRLRWWMEAWQSADRLRQSGVDVRAVTAWALLGSFNWHNLVTADTGSYEAGVFDLRSPAPRPTILAKAIRALAERGAYDHAVLDEPGWWRQPARLTYPTFQPAGRPAPAVEQPVLHSNERPRRKLLVTGVTGTLGSAFLRICEWRGIPAAGVTRRELDLTNPATVQEAMDHWQPWAVINAAGFVHVDAAEAESAVCFDVNTAGPLRLAEICAERHIPLLTFSSDLVFDGRKPDPYVESDASNPLNVYGASKAAAEQVVLTTLPLALIVRTSAFFGPWDEHNFLIHVLRRLALGETVLAADDTLVSPTYVPDLVNACLDLLVDGAAGIWHLANAGATHWHGFAALAAGLAGLDPAQIHAVPMSQLEMPAARPRNSALTSEKGWLLPPLEEALNRFLQEQRILGGINA